LWNGRRDVGKELRRVYVSERETGNRDGDPDVLIRLILLRHGQVASHRGDVPITDTGREQARRAGAWLARQNFDVVEVLYGGTRRTRETAEGVAAGLARDGSVLPTSDSFALRNPDLYLGGQRVTMVSGAEAFAEQVPALEPKDVLAVPFFGTWLTHPERVGFWVGSSHPPGDTAASVARRIDAFARSLADVPAWRGRTVIGVTHSPVLRSIGLVTAGTDPGEPPYVHGYQLVVRQAASMDVTVVSPATS
jgi:broad specificity phosphatase PhoE